MYQILKSWISLQSVHEVIIPFEFGQSLAQSSVFAFTVALFLKGI